jgi:tRNA1Val (adenine37-N6)-methyltransferase
MLAQNCKTSIDAIEIDKDAAEQAKENISATPWRDLIKIHNESLQAFIPEKKYDFIFSNPPFYEQDLKTTNQVKNLALHSTALKLEELVIFITHHLHENGIAGLLIPYSRLMQLQSLLKEKKLFTNTLMLVKQTTKHDYFRAMILFSKKENNHHTNEICITDENRRYTSTFNELLNDYYLDK